MLGYNDGGSGGKSANWYAATNGLAVTCAIICTLLGAPLLAEWSHDLMLGIIERSYGREWLEAGMWVWNGALAALVFFFCRVFFTAVVITFAVSAAQRFPMLAAM